MIIIIIMNSCNVVLHSIYRKMLSHISDQLQFATEISKAAFGLASGKCCVPLLSKVVYEMREILSDSGRTL